MYRTKTQKTINFGELVVDNFAGGGGASTGIEMAIGRSVDIAINHDQTAIDMHTINHPQTKHYNESVWNIDPRKISNGQPVGLAWFSPDCRHFSKAKGGKPVSKQVRGLAWVVLKWIGTVKPRVIILENVEEFLTWGPLIENKDGELVPDPLKKGKTFDSFVRAIRRQGYKVDWKQLRACDYGAPTIRKRLFLVARCDGLPISWPAATHGQGLKPYKTAADIIDWSLPCPSIFERKRPLAEKTLDRIAEGLRRYVFETNTPFIVDTAAASFITEHANGSSQRNFDCKKPLRTQCANVKGGHFALVQAFLAKHYTGVVGHPPSQPLGTITTQDHHSIITTNLIKLRGTGTAQSVEQPIPTLTAGGTHIAEVRAFLVKYYSSGGQWQAANDPVHTVPTKDRLGLVTVHGTDYQIIDIGMRMLQPHELYAAQSFPKNYIFTHRSDGTRITKTEQIAKCGNSVPPLIVAALVKENYLDQPCLEVAL